jgi:hypothetical protein
MRLKEIAIRDGQVYWTYYNSWEAYQDGLRYRLPFSINPITVLSVEMEII